MKKIIKAVKFQKVGLSLLALNKYISYKFTFPQNQKKSKLIYNTEPELKPIMKINFNIALQPLVNTCHTCMATLSEGSDAFDYFVSVPFL